jgi:hypothetical protein
MRLSLVTVAVAAWILGKPAYAKFGLTSNGNLFTVDTNGGLVFAVSKLGVTPFPPSRGADLSARTDSAGNLEHR